MSARPTSDAPVRPYEIAIVGNDMLLAALPGRAVQLAHAVQACGYDLVVPVSWGEELLAEHTLRRLEQAGPGPRVFCACPRVRARLTAAGNELAPFLLATIAPPAATARYLRALEPDVPMRITYLGSCEGARDPSIDIRVAPADFLRHLDARGISLVRQPSVYESTVPPDRRRHWSLPGGVPSAEVLEERGTGYRLLVIEGQELVADIAQHIIAADRVLIDPGPAVGCSCAGAYEVHRGVGARGALAALEPPRSPLPVIDLDRDVALEFPPLVGAFAVPEQGRPEPAALTSTEGIRSIQDAARLRAERRRIAVTPAGIGATARPRSNEPTPQEEPEAPFPTGVTPTGGPVGEPPPEVQEGHEARPPEVTAGALGAPAPGPQLEGPQAETTGLASREEPAAAVEVVEHGTGEVQLPAGERPSEKVTSPHRRTPVYELRQVARSVAHLRLRASGGEAVAPPRSYGTIRSRFPRAKAAPPPEPPPPPPVSPPAEPRPAPGEVQEAIRGSQPAVRVPSDLHRAAQAALRTRRVSTQEEKPRGERRLWGLLATAVLIATIALLLFVIFGL